MLKRFLTALVLIALCLPVQAAVVNLGVVNNGGGGVTSGTINPVANAVSSGTLVVVFCYDLNTTTPAVTVTDSKGNTYTGGPSINTPWGQYSFYSFITTPLTVSDTITCADSASTGFGQFYVSAVSASGYNAYDPATAASNNNGFTNSFSITGAGSAAVANEIYFAFSYSNTTFSGTPSGWSTAPPNTANAGQFLAGWQINAGTAALTWSGTTTGTQNTDSLILSFKPSAAAAAGILLLAR